MRTKSSGSITYPVKNLENNVSINFYFQNYQLLLTYIKIWYFQYYKGQSNNIPEEINRTMVFQIGRNDLRLISPDRKQILLHKQLKDIINCVQVKYYWIVVKKLFWLKLLLYLGC